MAYTFGAGTGDDINWSMILGPVASGRLGLIYGWWYPTTLTATRGLWSAGNTIGAEIDATTSELRLRTDNTTDGQWTTTGAGLAVDTWRFLAFMVACSNTGPAAAWRVWAGSIDSAPTEITVTNVVSPSGNFTANATFYIGNKGTGTLAFEGDIDEIGCFAANGTSTSRFIPNATSGSITDAEADIAYRNAVLPAWLGEPWRFQRMTHLSGLGEWGHISLRQQPVVMRSARTSGTPTSVEGSFAIPIINGATYSQRGCPRPYTGSVLHPASVIGF